MCASMRLLKLVGIRSLLCVLDLQCISTLGLARLARNDEEVLPLLASLRNGE